MTDVDLAARDERERSSLGLASLCSVGTMSSINISKICTYDMLEYVSNTNIFICIY